MREMREVRTTESVVALLDGKGVGLVLEMSRQDVHEEADEVRGRLEDEREQRQTDEHLTRMGPHTAVSFASISRYQVEVGDGCGFAIAYRLGGEAEAGVEIGRVDHRAKEVEVNEDVDLREDQVLQVVVEEPMACSFHTHTHTHTQYGLVSERRRWSVGGEWVTELVGENGEDPVFVDLLQDRIVQHDALVLPEAIEVGL